MCPDLQVWTTVHPVVRKIRLRSVIRLDVIAIGDTGLNPTEFLLTIIDIRFLTIDLDQLRYLVKEYAFDEVT